MKLRKWHFEDGEEKTEPQAGNQNDKGSFHFLESEDENLLERVDDDGSFVATTIPERATAIVGLSVYPQCHPKSPREKSHKQEIYLCVSSCTAAHERNLESDSGALICLETRNFQKEKKIQERKTMSEVT